MSARREVRSTAFFSALFFLCAGTLMYEVLLTRLLSVTSWYYLAFVSISMAMFGMTAGALAVQLRQDLFQPDQIRHRLAQASFAMAVSLPIVLMTVLAVPVDLSLALQTLYSFLLLSAVISVPFFFSGVAVCLALTRSPFPVGRIYCVDLLGAAFGCLASVGLLQLVDAPSGIFVISAILFLSAAANAFYAGETGAVRRNAWIAAAMLTLGVLNSLTLYGIQPIWVKGRIDHRTDLLAEIWNPISKIRARKPETVPPMMWGPSPKMPADITIEQIGLDIDNDAATPLMQYKGDLRKFEFLNYDVTSLAAQLRGGGSAAVIGVGGGRDVLTAAVNGFRRVVGIEVNSAMVELTSRRLTWFSDITSIPNFELHNDEGRSYLTRAGEDFDLIQASLVDTWAATSAGAMTLSENALYTVDGWKIFYEHLTPTGAITFSRWYDGAEVSQTYRLFAVASAMLYEEGVKEPSRHLALVGSAGVATLIATKQPFTKEELARIREISENRGFSAIYLPDEVTKVPELRTIAAARNLDELMALRNQGTVDYSPVYDNSPYFFNAVHLNRVPELILAGGHGNNLRAILFVLGFMLAAVIMAAVTIVLPLQRWSKQRSGGSPPSAGGLIYFLSIGVGFMLIEMGMMQQLSIFLGHPIYSLVVVLAGLILSSGAGSLVSDTFDLKSSWQSGLPAWVVVAVVVLYASLVVNVTHAFTAGELWQRTLVSLALVLPCGFVMGFCFPMGMRWMATLNQKDNLPWMWALNGAAGTLGSFIAILISMDTSITVCLLTGAACYALAGLSMPVAVPRPVQVPVQA